VSAPVRIGVSACLLGREVRYDGGHKREEFLVEDLAPHAQLVDTCPEVEVGMGTPREPIRLEAERVRGVRSGRDWTDELRAHAERRVGELAALGLAGYVLKSRSPSCGLGVPGVFASELVARLPELPVVEEDALRDPDARDHFLTRAYAHARVRSLLDAPWTPGDLVRFHSTEKLLLLAHAPSTYAALGRLVAEAGTREREELGAAYATGVGAALAEPATRGRHANTLEHLAGMLAPGSSLTEEIFSYRSGETPRRELLERIEELAEQAGNRYVAAQTYLRPYPRVLMTA
jgi:uncharacterized protein YbbK (DUF523 family)/uncharacterized protein YbgA (DUF1722 family)